MKQFNPPDAGSNLKIPIAPAGNAGGQTSPGAGETDVREADLRQMAASTAAAAKAIAESLHDIAVSRNTIGASIEEQASLRQGLERARAGLASAQKELQSAKVQSPEPGRISAPARAAAAEKADIHEKRPANQQQEQVEIHDAPDAADGLRARRLHIADAPASNAAPLKKHDDGAMPDVPGIKANPIALPKPDSEAMMADKNAPAAVMGKAGDNAKTIADLAKEIDDLKKSIQSTGGMDRGAPGTKETTVPQSQTGRLAQQFVSDFKALDRFARNTNPNQLLLEQVKQALSEFVSLLADHSQAMCTLPDYRPAIEDLRREILMLKAQNANTLSTQSSG